MRFSMKDLENITKEDLDRMARELENKQQFKSQATASEKQLIEADKKGVRKVVNSNKIQSTQVLFGAPIGTNVKAGKNVNKNTGIWATQDNRKITDIETRKKLGMSTRLDNVDYTTRLVNGKKVKTCCSCQGTWNVSNFSKDAKREDKLKDTCKDCGKKSDAARVYIPVSQRKKVENVA